MPAGIMRALLCESIEQFIDPHQLAVMEAAEKSERLSLHRLAESIRTS